MIRVFSFCTNVNITDLTYVIDQFKQQSIDHLSRVFQLEKFIDLSIMFGSK